MVGRHWLLATLVAGTTLIAAQDAAAQGRGGRGGSGQGGGRGACVPNSTGSTTPGTASLNTTNAYGYRTTGTNNAGYGNNTGYGSGNAGYGYGTGTGYYGFDDSISGMAGMAALSRNRNSQGQGRP